MDNLTIKTNSHYRPLIYGNDLTAKERKEFDYYNDGALYDASFFRYKGCTYDLGKFMRCPNGLSLWDGYESDSYFSGVLIKFSGCGEYVKVARYYS
jgi:hypothetical protein